MKKEDIQKWQATFKEKVLDNPKYKWYRRGVWAFSALYASFIAYQSFPYYANIGTGESHFKKGEYKAAEENFQEALQICQSFGPDYLKDQRTVRALNNLAELYRGQGRYKEALPYYEKTIANIDSCFRENRPERALVHSNFAACLRDLGLYKEADKQYDIALSTWESKVKQPDSPILARMLCGQAKLRKEQGRYEEAEKLLQKALTISEKSAGKNDVANADILSQTGALYKDLKQYDKARTFYKRAFDMDMSVHGPTHPDTAADFNNLAALEGEVGNYKLSKEYFEKALNVRLNKLGPDHRLTAKTYMGMAELNRLEKRYPQAFDLCVKAMDIQRRALPQEHPDRAECLDIMGSIFRDQGEREKAVGFYKESLAIRSKLLQTGHPDLLQSQAHLHETLSMAQPALKNHQ